MHERMVYDVQRTMYFLVTFGGGTGRKMFISLPMENIPFENELQIIDFLS